MVVVTHEDGQNLHISVGKAYAQNLHTSPGPYTQNLHISPGPYTQTHLDIINRVFIEEGVSLADFDGAITIEHVLNDPVGVWDFYIDSNISVALDRETAPTDLINKENDE